MESLDPRIQRLDQQEYRVKTSPDQLHTFEVFTQLKEGKPYIHTGIVHASDIELAFLFAKEQFSRRQTCSGMLVIDTSDIFVTEYTDGDMNAFERFEEADSKGDQEFAIFTLPKRGKQQVLSGIANASDHINAIEVFQKENPELTCFNIWVCPTDKILQTEESLREIWDTLGDKKYRDAIIYKAGDKLKNFLKRDE